MNKKKAKKGRKPANPHFEWIFINGKQKRVRRHTEPTIDGMTFEDFCRADPVLAHQEGMWHLIDVEEDLPTADPTFIAECRKILFELPLIHQRKVDRMRSLADWEDSSFSELASVMYGIAQLHPEREGRFDFLQREHPELVDELARLSGIGAEFKTS